MGNKVIWALRRIPRVSARRAVRVTVVGSGSFSFVYEVMHNPTAAFFAAFGSVVLLVYVEYGGPRRQRYEQHVGLIVITFFLVFLGTVCSQVLWLAATSAVLVCFCILMSGVVSSSLAGSSTAMLISFLLPVAFQGSISTIPNRLLGWAIAGGASLLAVAFILPAPSADPLVDVTSNALDRISVYLDALATDTGTVESADGATSSALSNAALTASRMRDAFFAAPFRPAGLSASARLLVKVIEWTLDLDTLIAADIAYADEIGGEELRAVMATCATVLKESGGALRAIGAETVALSRSLVQLREGRMKLERSVLRSLHRHETANGDASPDAHDTTLLSLLDESFRTDNVADTVEKLGTEVMELVASRCRTWWQQLFGLEAKGSDSRLDAARRRLRSHLSRRSVWLHNSARGAIGLGLSVFVAYSFGVQHAFWVVFGTLAVLRSNALSTGQTVVKALTGTIEGIVIGSVIIALVGSHEMVFWILLPFAICFTGFAPSAISFAAGQAGFTMTILILFNIVDPTGWTIGVVRFEDVALGCAVSLVVGVLLWPRGATSTLRDSIADAINESVHFLRSTVMYGLAQCDVSMRGADNPIDARRSAQAAARRLDDAFREYLSERGSKSVSLADVSTLLAGITAVRTTADSIEDLWRSDTSKQSGDRTVVREALSQGIDSLSLWYGQLSDVIVGSEQNLSEPTDFTISVAELVNTVRHDLSDADGNGTETAFKIVWTDDYLRQLHQLQRRMIPVVVKIASTGRTSAGGVSRPHRPVATPARRHTG
jgi:uncharacterized membrane protein YccC